MPNLVGLVMLIAMAALLAWSGIRAWRAKNNFLKWGGTGLAALLAAAVSIVGVLCSRCGLSGSAILRLSRQRTARRAASWH
jgi:hypothetical protein